MASKKAALRAALPHTIPVFTGYIVLGTAFGILMDSKGLSLLWILLASTFIYAGSMQFLAVAMIAAGLDPIYAFLMTLIVNARHLFYGLSMLEKYRGLGKLKPYLIFSLTDETFSLLCTVEVPKGVNRKWFFFFISVLDHLYWILGSLLGGILGSMIPINTKGMDFVLTALFVVLFLNQWQSTKNHLPAILGVAAAFLCRLVFGASDFILPTMLLLLIALLALKRPLEGRRRE
jgi:4-azaleucine resistance transporter AzlC